MLVYGASTAIGAYALKLLKRAAVRPVIAVGSKNSSFLTHLLDKDKGDAFIDYTAFDSPDKLADGLATALQRTGATTQLRAFDCVSENGTYEVLGKALAAASPADGPRPLLVVCLPGQDLNQMDPRVEVLTTSVGRVHKDEDGGQLFGAVWATALATGLKEGWLVPHPYESVQGLESLEIALKGLREGRVRGKKMVVRIAEGK